MAQTIMVIDDETEILDMLKRYFSLEGYHVITAAGGDDYIVKPFSIDELGARVSAHLRRENRSKRKSRVLFDEQLAVDYLERAAYWDGQEIPLLKKEFDILYFGGAYFLQKQNQEAAYAPVHGVG